MSWENSVSHRLTTAAQVEGILGRPPSMIMLKQIDVLDEGCRAVLAQCALAGFGFRDAGGISRTTFIGGTAGFVRVHSPTRISFTLAGHEAHGPVSFVFLLPGIGETLRVNGSVAKRKDAETFVDVREAYVHCAQAVIRSRLWQPAVPAGPTPAVEGDGPLCGPGVADFLAAAPFLALSTWDSSGGCDTSPRGDRQTVARILDGRTLVIPDRNGNKRADSLHNLLQDDRLSFAALVPGRTGVLHVSGRGAITDDPALLETMALRGTPPHAALVIDVDHAEVTASDALTRSRVWHPGTRLERGSAPDLLAMAGNHLAMNLADSSPLKRVTRMPGIGRVLRFAMNLAYRFELKKEGYENVEVGSRSKLPAAELVNPLREVRIAEVRRETPSAVTLVLEDTGPFDFRPGQFFTLVADIDGRPVRRAYSASSAPGTTRLEVTVKQVDGGRFSTHAHRGLRAGDRLSVRGPSGTFHLDPAASHDVVMIAAGSGVTPMMSMIRALLAAPAAGRIALLCSSRSAEDVIFADELLRLEKENPDRFAVTHVLTRERGRLDAAGVHAWLTELRPPEDARYYLCGPEALMEMSQRVLAEFGVPDDRVHHERYTSGADPATPATAPQMMTIVDGGRAVVEPGQTLLDAGLAAGLPMPYSCTVGNCGDCVVRLVGGEVAMGGPNCLTPQQKADGHVLTCVGFPLSEVTLDITED